MQDATEQEIAARELATLPEPEPTTQESVIGNDAAPRAAGETEPEATPAAPAPPQSYKLAGEGAATLIGQGVEWWRPDFPLDDDEHRELAEDIARVAPKYAPQGVGEHEPEIKLALTALGILIRRWRTPRKVTDGRLDNAGAGSDGRGQDVRDFGLPARSAD